MYILKVLNGEYDPILINLTSHNEVVSQDVV